MHPKYYKQENGLIDIPSGYDKFHISWSMDNVLSGFRQFYKENDRWPVASDMNTYKYLPNVKTLNRKFGGITNIRKELGLVETNYTKGVTRSKKSKVLWDRGFKAEQDVYAILKEYYHEPFVHNQARVVVGDNTLKADFIVYHKSGKYAVDVFFPDSEISHFTNNLIHKIRTYKNFPYKIYLVVSNKEISESTIEERAKTLRVSQNINIKLVSFNTFVKEISKYKALSDPYLK
ncbi:MAG: hypothetical protein WC693_00435 [Patescibacteria group bacterium]|jgi:hypothetical protein